MRVVVHTSPESLLKSAGRFLMEREAENNFILGKALEPVGKTRPLLVTVQNRAKVVAAGFMTPGRHMMLTRASGEAIAALVDEMRERRIELPGIQSRPLVARKLARAWTARTGQAAFTRARFGIFRLARVISPEDRAAGAMRAAETRDLNRLGRWVDAFSVEIGERGGDGAALAERLMRSGRLFVWSDRARVVSMAAWGRPTPNGCAIFLVYTPKKMRGRGYATACVAALSQRMLDSGRQFCTLYTDLANVTSNGIYQRIGYRRIATDEQIFFRDITST